MKNIMLFVKPRSDYFFKTGVEYWLAVSILFSIGLVIIGGVFSESFVFAFLVWNLFLAFIPYVLSKWMLRNIGWHRNRLQFIFGIFLWILFIPNSFYIVTDLFHLGSFINIPAWYELAMILSVAWNGLLLGVLSVRQMERLFNESLSISSRLLFIYPVMFLNALGIYIGRYMRFNSWDVVTNPFHLFQDISDLALHPIQYRYAWSMIVCFSIFMTLIFFTLMNANKEATER